MHSVKLDATLRHWYISKGNTIRFHSLRTEKECGAKKMLKKFAVKQLA